MEVYGRFFVTKRTSDRRHKNLIQKYHQYSFMVKKCFNEVTRVYFEYFVRETNCCVCPTVNENSMPNYNTKRLILKVHIWDIMFAREKYLESIWKSGTPMARHPDRTHLRALSSSNDQQPKFVFVSLTIQFNYNCQQSIRPRSTLFQAALN